MSADEIKALATAIAVLVAEFLRADADRLLDRPALAQRLAVGERTVGAMVSRGELPPPLLCTAGTARWHWPSVLKFLASKTSQVRRGRGRWDRNGKREQSHEG
jgi:hypothetical protein